MTRRLVRAVTTEMSVELGRGSGLRLHVPLAIGTLQWGTTWVDHHWLYATGCITEETAADIMTACREARVTLFDSAEGYGGGTSELRLGRLTSSTLNTDSTADDDTGSPILMTKFLPTPWRFTKGHFEAALRASLARLKIDCCPVYLLHTPVHWRPIEFWVEAAAECRKKGLLEAFGLSNCDAEQVRRAHAAGQRFGVPVVVNQVMYNLLDYGSPRLREMEEACNELGITILAYATLGQGLLTDSLTPEKLQKNRPAKMTGLTWERLAPVRETLRAIAEERGVTMAQVCVNWTICHGAIPLVGCRSIKQAADTTAALGWRLTADEVARLDKVALARSTLESPAWRRQLFVVLAGVVMAMCQLCQLVGLGWVGEAR